MCAGGRGCARVLNDIGLLLQFPDLLHLELPVRGYLYFEGVYYTLGIQYARNAPWESSVGELDRGRLTR